MKTSCIFALMMVTISASSAAFAQAVTPLTLSRWNQIYVSSNPFSAMRRTTPISISKEAIDELMDGDDKVAENHFLYLRQHGIDRATIKYIVSELQKDLKEKNSSLTARDLSLRKNLAAFVTEKVEAGTLRIAYVGMAHAIDFYLMYPGLELGYVAKPFSSTSEQFTAAYRRLNEHLTKKKISPTLADDMHSLAWAHYRWVLDTLMVENRPMPDIVENPRPNTATILPGEFHNANETRWLRLFPDARELKANGIRKIRLGLEGVPAGPTDFSTMFKRRTLIEQFEYRAKKLGMTFDELVSRILPHDICKDLLEGKVQDNPALLVLLKRLEAYEAQGINVELVGLEDKNYNPLGE